MVATVVEQGFPKDRPLFRADCALHGSSRSAADPPVNSGYEKRNFFSRLVNVHEGLDAAGVTGGSVSLVSGQYEYYHYTQVRTYPRSTASIASHLIAMMGWALGDIRQYFCVWLDRTELMTRGGAARTDHYRQYARTPQHLFAHYCTSHADNSPLFSCSRSGLFDCLFYH